MDRLDEITKDCFNALIQMREIEPTAALQPANLHRRICTFVDTMMGRAAEVGFRQEDTADMAYAIVALADEIMLSKAGPIQQYWMANLLQLRYFNENVAGDNFFVRLEQVIRDPARVEVLRVYHLCLALGFQGRYRVRGGEVELQNIVDAVQGALGRARLLGGELLSPQGARPPDMAVRARRTLPIVALAVAAVLLAVGLNVGLRLYLGSEVDTVVDRIHALQGGAK